MRKQLCYDQCGANCEEHVWSYQVIPNPETRINTKYQYDLVEMFQENVQPGDPNTGARRYMIYVPNFRWHRFMSPFLHDPNGNM